MNISKPPFGLVLAGGKSERMKRDKGGLSYFGKPQVGVAFDLLEISCARVFISCRENQSGEEHLKSFPQIHDASEALGPLAGLVAAMEMFPGEAWVVLACDMPFFQRNALEKLIRDRDPEKMATAFWNAGGAFPEPLCTLYENRYISHLKSHLGPSEKFLCPRKILTLAEIKTILPEDPRWIDNINTPPEWSRAREELAHSPISGGDFP